MCRVFVSVALFLTLTTSAFAQDVAAVNPDVPIPEVAPVVGACEIVAAAPELSSPNGPCITATRSFLGALAIPSLEADVHIQELLVALLELSQLFPDCDIFDDELAAAIREAAAAVSDPELAAQLLVAATAIDDCVVTNLGAIPPVGSSGIGVIPG